LVFNSSGLSGLVSAVTFVSSTCCIEVSSERKEKLKEMEEMEE
jgi:hypothetical protein